MKGWCGKKSAANSSRATGEARFRPQGLHPARPATLVLLLLAAAGASVPVRADLSPDTVRLLQDAVVKVERGLLVEAACGSGFVISAEGQIVTCAHVVNPVCVDETGRWVQEDDQEIRVVFHPGTVHAEEYEAQVVRADTERDLALLKVETETPHFLKLGNSDQTQGGGEVYVCGYPGGSDVPERHRGKLWQPEVSRPRGCLWSDAVTQGGNSGGPLVDSSGEVLGVTSSRYTFSGQGLHTYVASRVVSEWLQNGSEHDTAPPRIGETARKLLKDSGRLFVDCGGGLFALPCDNGETVFVREMHHCSPLGVHFFVPLGETPKDSGGKADGFRCLQANYGDRLGCLVEADMDPFAAWRDQATSPPLLGLTSQVAWNYLEAAEALTPAYLQFIIQTAAERAQRWKEGSASVPAPEPPGGSLAEEGREMLGKFRQILSEASVDYYDQGQELRIPWWSGTIQVRAQEGVLRLYQNYGPLPGKSPEHRGQSALRLYTSGVELLTGGRLAVDRSGGVVLEALSPIDYFYPPLLLDLLNGFASLTVDVKARLKEIETAVRKDSHTAAAWSIRSAQETDRPAPTPEEVEQLQRSFLEENPALRAKLQQWEREAPPEVKKEIALLREGSSEEQMEAVERLMDLGSRARGAILALIEVQREKIYQCRLEEKDQDPSLFLFLILEIPFQVLVGIGEPAVEPLIAVLRKQEEDEWFREAAVEALGEIQGVRAVEPLIAALQDEAWEVREAAAEALEAINPRWGQSEAARRAVPDFLAALREEKGLVRYAAAEALGEIRDARAVEPLIAALRDKVWPVREAAAHALKAIAPRWPESEMARQAVPDFLAALRDEAWDVRYAAAETLGNIRDARAVEPLIAALQDEDPGVRKVALEALQRITKQRFGEEVQRWEEWWQKYHASSGL